MTDSPVSSALIASVEAVLYGADEPVSADRLLEVIRASCSELRSNDLAMETVRSACLELEESYRARGSALQVIEIAGGYRLGTRTRFDAVIRALRQVERPTQLSIPALETLAVVAYRQPTTIAEIRAIRGKDPGAALRRLRDLRLVRITGRRRAVGRPFTYGTTNRFLELFGLRDLKELPSEEEFQELLET